MHHTLVALSLAASLLANAPLGLLDRFSTLLATLEGDSPAAQQAQSKAGCRIDPWGRCLPGRGDSPQAPSADAGCTIDPWGQCSPGQ